MAIDADQATKTLRQVRQEYSEADDFSRTVDHRHWDQLRDDAHAIGLEAGMTEAEVEAILEGNG